MGLLLVTVDDDEGLLFCCSAGAVVGKLVALSEEMGAESNSVSVLFAGEGEVDFDNVVAGGDGCSTFTFFSSAMVFDVIEKKKGKKKNWLLKFFLKKYTVDFFRASQSEWFFKI